MSPAGVRTDAEWRGDVVRVLARLCRAHGLDGLRRTGTFKALLSVVGASEVESAAALVPRAPDDQEREDLAKAARDLLAERKQIRLAAAAEPRNPPEPSAETPRFAVAEPRPEAPPPAPVFVPSAAEAPPEPPDPTPDHAFVTHLPLYSLAAVAASLPAGEWGSSAAAPPVERLGWVPVDLGNKRLNPRMFVARVEGHSMDDGKTGIRDGAGAVFEFGAGDFDLAPIVLARGAFDDPETGSYAVKRIRVEKAPDGRVERFRLVSANPDKSRYPDIVVHERDGAAVTVLARFVAALGPDDHARVPRRAAEPRRRDIASPEGIEKHRARLAKALARFFGPPGAGAAGEGDAGAAGDEDLAWSACLVLPACDPGALAAEVGPLAGLLSRVKTVAVETGSLRRVVFASNLRTKRFREPVPPSCEPYRWSAEGFEDELAEEMERLTVPGLAADAATVFRIGADGTGQRLAGASVTPGNAYRLLVPPALAGVEIPGAVERDGFRAFDLEVPSPVPETTVDQLRSIGVAVGADAYSMAFAVTSPRDHGHGQDGELYPSFAPGDAVFVAVSGPPALLDGDVLLVVQGEQDSARLALPAGERWLVELRELVPGGHVVEVLPLRTSVETTRLFFRVDDRARPLPRADVTIRLGPSEDAPGPAEAVSLEQARSAFTEDLDLASLGTDKLPLAIAAPPLWPVSASFQGVTRVRGPVVAADEDGSVDAGVLLARTGFARQDELLGTLTLDFGELGTLALSHRRRLAVVAAAGLAAICAERLPALPSLTAEVDLFYSQWLTPVCKILGYSMRPLPPLATLDLPAGFSARLLETTVRNGSSIERRAAKVLLVAPARLPLSGPGADPAASKTESLRLCKKVNLPEAIVTDGRAWSRVRAGLRLMSTPVDIEDALRRAPLGGLEDFLGDFLPENVG